jgi:3',5'-cyclic AMP phosphodiesterase CpdA
MLSTQRPKELITPKNYFSLLILVLCISVSGIACKKFVFNVYETNRSEEDLRVTTNYNIDLLLSKPRKDTLRVIFIGDTQRFNDEVKDFVESANAHADLDAVVIAGDITDFGISLEFDLMNRELKKLKVPFITVVGNHDILSNGTELYEDIYGPLNYSFTWNDVRFIVHNTNGRKSNFNGKIPDLNWMGEQLIDSSTFQSCIFVSHVPPYHEDFDSKLEEDYAQIVREAKNTIFSSNGHNHAFALTQPYHDGIWYLNTSSPSHRIYSYVSIYPYSNSAKKFGITNIMF